jgi:hypothetical protein
VRSIRAWSELLFSAGKLEMRPAAYQHVGCDPHSSLHAFNRQSSFFLKLRNMIGTHHQYNVAPRMDE